MGIAQRLTNRLSLPLSHRLTDFPVALLGGAASNPQPPTGALAVWDVANYSATPVPHIKPVGSSATADGNLLRGGRRLISSFLGSSSATVTYGFAAGWDGTASMAIRFVGAAVAWDFFSSTTFTLAAGDWTLSFYVKSNTGSSQNFRMGIQTGYSGLVTKTATTSWTRVETTVTLASPATNRYIWLCVPVNSGVDTADILFDDIRIEAGSAATDTPSQAGVMYLGRQGSGATVPAVASGAVQFSSGKPCLAQFADLTTFANISMCAYVKKTAASAAATSFMSKFGAQYTHAMIEESAGGIFGYAGQNTSSNESIPSPLCNLEGDGYHLVAFTRDSTYVWLYIDDIPIGRQAHASNTPAQVQDWLINDQSSFTNNLFFGGQIALWGLWDRALTQAEVASLREYCKAQRVANGDTAGTISNLICYVGDSISSVRSYSFAYPSKVTTSEKAYGMVPARAGYRLADIQNAGFIAWIDSCLSETPGDTTRNNILTSLIGANGLNGLTSPQVTTWIADYLAWGQARRAAGWKWAPATVLPISGATSHNANRATVNAAISSWLGLGYCDAVIDVASDATIGPDAAAANATYYSDGTHPTNAGHVIIAPYFQTAINSLL